MTKTLKTVACVAALTALSIAAARAEDAFRLAVIDPLSGPAATTGEVGLKTWQFLAGEVNAAGGINGVKIDVTGYDNKLNAQETSIQAQKAIDSGARLLVRANGGAPGVALNEFLNKFNERNPTQQTIYFDYAGTDPTATNEKCSYWQIRWASNTDMKVLALSKFLKEQKDLKKVYLFNGDYSTGQGIQKGMRANLASMRPDVSIVGDELVPLMKINDFAPYVEKIKASGADAVVTGEWGQDLALLLKAGGEAGLKVKWYTFFAQGIGSPTAVRQSGLPAHSVYQIYEAHANVPFPAYQEEEKRFRGVVGSGQTMMYPASVNAMDVFTSVARELKTLDVTKIIAKMEGMKFKPRSGAEAWIRAEDHQVFQPLYVATLGPIEKGEGFDEENTGWGWRHIGEIKAEETVVPTTCQMKRPQ
ncbi:ABC transporter substrate-binding protein [Bradyrhizobium sp.]|uniref:ABC transporter substrate-binding protein n=1 Tax=Bradyrhizobium sp. TaxID=376 RepID=UPI0039E641EA